MLRPFLIALLCSSLALGVARAQDETQQVVVQDPFIEMHTGPALAYPVFYVVDRGASIDVLSRRTDWFKVRAPRGQE
ncbi:MAG TPA: SH3 domain-containing protein, partial [Gammaproteobacteria bacterium]|nr:SH3 domain-containing protein [Gammaproteobacteria bacterium]